MTTGSGGGAAPTRATVFHCPYCGEEDLRPHEASHGAWSCRDCRRVFSVSFLGVLSMEGSK